MTPNEPLKSPWSLSPGSLALLACLGGALGCAQAVLGLLLGAGGVRFSIAAAIVGGLTWLASRGSGRPAFAEIVKLSGRVGALTLIVVCGAALGLGSLGRDSANALSPLWLTDMVVLLAIVSGAGASLECSRRLDRMVPGLLVTLVAGAAAGAALGQFFTWAPAKFVLWGVGSGGGLAMALSWLAGPRPWRPDSRAALWFEHGLMFLAAALVLFNSALPHGWDDSGIFNLYTHQAIAFLHGRLDVQPISMLDVSRFGGRLYVPFPPFPAVVLMPLIWARGNVATPTLPMSLISACLGAFSAVVVADILRRVGIDRSRRYWSVAAFVFGTGLWIVLDATMALASYFAYAVSVLCLLLAIWEAFGSIRGILTGLFLGMAFVSRPVTVMAAVFIVVLLLEPAHGSSLRRKWLNCVGFAAGAGICGVAFLLFNQLRFGDPLEMGHTFVNNGGHLFARLQQYGVFNVVYVPSNLYYLFLHGFHLEFTGPTLLTPTAMDRFGTSLTVASPFAFLALWGRGKRRLVWGAWASILAMMALHLLYHTQGFAQVNTQRYTLDYFPILIVLIALGAQRVGRGVFEGLVAYAIALNLIALPFLPLSGLW